MNEIFRNSTHNVYLDIHGGVADAPPTAVVGTTPLAVQGPETIGAAQRWTAIVSLAQTQNVGPLAVDWSFSIGGQPVQKTDYFSVVVPLVDISDVRGELEVPVNITDSQIMRAERQVRRIVERTCGQQFSPTKETVLVKGSGATSIKLPKRLISIDNVTDPRTGLQLVNFDIRNDGWNLIRTSYMYNSPTLTVTGPIFDPYNYNYTLTWLSGHEWSITGTWGWNYPPPAVQDATLVLIEQRLCPETIYRDNYFTSMKASDWRFDIGNGAFTGTGNVVSDQLLAPYIVSNVAVI